MVERKSAPHQNQHFRKCHLQPMNELTYNIELKVNVGQSHDTESKYE